MKALWIAALMVPLLLPAAAISAPAVRLNDAAVRAFIAAQNRAWNGHDLGRFYGTFDPHAAIVLVTMQNGTEVARRVRTLAEDRSAAERFFAAAHAKIRETDRVEKVAMAPDGRHAHVRVQETTRMVRRGRARVLHATIEQELVLRGRRIVSAGLMEFDRE